MAEQNIMNIAQDFTVSKYCTYPWICRDDSNNYWVVIRNTSDNLEVYKSIDAGLNWVLKKTIANTDFPVGNPFPTNNFKILNLRGQDKIYVFCTQGSDVSKMYGWIFEVTADTNKIDLDSVDTFQDYEPHVCWTGSLMAGTIRNFAKGEFRWWTINLNGTATYGSYLSDYGRPLSFYAHSDGSAYYLGESLTDNNMILSRAWVTSLSIALTKTNLIFADVVADSAGHPIVGYLYLVSGSYYFYITKRNKDSLITEILSTNHIISPSATTVPDICRMTVDGSNNIYFFYTDGVDKEAYYMKYDVTTYSWDAEVKISSNNDGKLVMPEIKPPITDSKILTTYQATV
jgi:hypothetical protein